MVRGVQPLYSFARREQTGQIQPSTIQTINARMDVGSIRQVDDDDDDENRKFIASNSNDLLNLNPKQQHF